MPSRSEPVCRLSIFVINLDHATERLDSVSKQLRDRGLNYTRWRATSGSELDPACFGRREVQEGIFVSGFRNWSLNEAACGVSHIRLLREIALGPAEWALVLEDDVEIVGELPCCVEDLDLPSDAEIVFVNERALGHLPDQPSAYLRLAGGAGTEGYLVSRAGAKKLLKALYPLKDPLDFQMFSHCESVQSLNESNMHWRLPQNQTARDVLLKAYRSARHFVSHAGDVSTIGAQRHPRARFFCKVLLGLEFDDVPRYAPSGPQTTYEQGRKIDEVRGVDISHLTAAEYYGFGGEKLACPLKFLSGYGANCARISVWTAAASAQGLDRALKLGALAHEAGLPIYLALHFSDFWADPAHQRKPAGWRHLSGGDLAEKVAAHADHVVSRFFQTGIPVSIVQIGNETTNGFLWEEAGEDISLGARVFHRDGGTAENWNNFIELFSVGASAARNAARSHGSRCAIALQIDQGAWPERASWWFEQAMVHGADFDILALSYYSLWHEPATLAGINRLQLIAETFPDKSVLIAETSYPHRAPEGLRCVSRHGDPEFSASGQYQYLKRMFEASREIGLRGVIWWGGFFDSDEIEKCEDVFRAQTLFDHRRRALPVTKAFGAKS